MSSRKRENTVALAAPQDIKVIKGLSATPIEASGICFLPDMGNYIVVSDETDKKTPDLFFMDSNGNIATKTTVAGLSRINDMEGITLDGHGFFYLLASQSYNKKNERPPERTLLARLRRTGSSFILDKSVLLAECLLTAADAAGAAPWAEFVRRGLSDKSIDIEGVAALQDTLLFGFKNPKMNNDAIILAIAGPDLLFEQNRLTPRQVSIWRTLKLCDKYTGTFCGVSDLCFQGDFLYGVSTGVTSRSGVEEDIGLFWQYIPKTGVLKVLHSFSGLKPEGIAGTGTANKFFITFDNGSRNPSQLLTVKVSE